MQRSTGARRLSFILGFTSFVLTAAVARAAITTFEWNQNTPNLNWSIPTDWTVIGSDSPPANGAGDIADFLDGVTQPSGQTAVNVNQNFTIGSIIFGNNWLLQGAGGMLTLDNTGGTGAPKITLKGATSSSAANDAISAILAGTSGVTLFGNSTGATSLTLSGANTYSGTTTINSGATGSNMFVAIANNNLAFGTSTVFLDPGTGGAQAKIQLNSGISIANNIVLHTERTATGNGSIQTNGDVTATVTGSITKQGIITQGAEFLGPLGTNSTNFLILTGPIVDSLASIAPNTGGGTWQQSLIGIRAGNVRFANPNNDSGNPALMSNAWAIEERGGTVQVGATDGIATNAYVDIGGNVNGGVGPNYAKLDLNGFNQSLVGVSNYFNLSSSTALSQTANEFITNSSATTTATLTLKPVDPTLGAGHDANQANLIFTDQFNGIGTSSVEAGTFNTAFITDSATTSGGAGSLNIVINGDANGIQYFTTPNGQQHGSVTLTSGIFAISSLAAGGTASSLGASSNAASNLVFAGGTLRYVNTTPNGTLSNATSATTDRNFQIADGTTGTIDIASAGTTVTWTGGSVASAGFTTGTLNKAGAGTLILSGTNQHAGGTNVSAGTLLVNSPGSLSGTGAVNVANLATLGGNGTIAGAVTLASGATLLPGNPAVASGVGTLTVGSLTLNNGSITNFEFGSGNDVINVTGTGGLTLNGGNINLFQAGGSTAFSTNGNYTLMNIVGGIGSGSLTNLTVTNPTAGKLYSLTSSSIAVLLSISNASTAEWTNGSGDGLWTTNASGPGGNWVDPNNSNAPVGFPNAAGVTAKFGQLTGGGTVNMNGNKTASGLLFDNTSGYTINGSGTLTLNNGAAAAAVQINNGSHTIAVPLSSTKTISTSFVNSNTALTISQPITGGAPMQISGTGGTLTLTANNSFSSTTLSASTLNVGTFGGSDTSGTLGTGNVTMSNGATLNFNRADSSPGYTFSGNIVGSNVNAGSINQLGSGTTTLSGAISNVTNVNINAGTLVTSSTMSQTGGITLNNASSWTAGGSVSGTGALTMNSTGTVNLNAANSYSAGNSTTAGTTINSGTVNLNAAGALPAATSLAMNGGTLNLNGQNISLSNFLDSPSSTGVITNNAANSTATITFSASSAKVYNVYAALNDNTGVNGKVAISTNIPNGASGPPIFGVIFNASSTFSGGLTVNSQSIEANNITNAFGTGPITVTLNNAAANSSQIFLTPGATITNNITIQQGKVFQNLNLVTSGFGLGTSAVIAQTAAGADTTVNGTVTILANNNNGGLFQGPTGGNFLNILGAVNAAGTADTIIQTLGNVKYFGGNGASQSYANMLINGTAALGATNGLAQNAVLQFSTLPATAVQAATQGILDLNGFDQTVVGLSSTATGALTPVVQNSGTGTNTLTLNTTGTNTFNGSINNGNVGNGYTVGPVNLTIVGSGTQALTGTSSYTGITTFSGTSVVQASSISTGGSSSSIGAATSDPSELVFDGGALQYTGASSTSTDHGFTINSGKTAHIGVNTAGVNLTLTGTSPVSTGSFEKTGPGNLTFDGAASIGYTGSTTVTGGRLFVNNLLTGTSSISVATGATLAGSGTIGSPTSIFTHSAGTINPGVVGGASAGTLTIGGNLTLAGGKVTYDVDDNQLGNSAAQDLVKINGVFNVTASTPVELDFLNPSAAPTPFSYTLFQFSGGTSTSLSTLQSDLVFTTNLTAGRLSASPIFSGNSVVINVTVAPAGQLLWNSTSSGAWDTSTQNWFNNGTSAVDKYTNGDQVTFADQTHGGSTPQNAITIAGSISPSVFNITSNTVNYTFSGAGSIIGSGVLNISGNSTTTIKTNNSFSGGTNITSSSATVDVGGGGTSGTLGTGDVQNNGTLKFTRTDGSAVTPVTFVNNINGSGNLINSCSGTTVMSGNINQNSVTLNGSGTTTLSGSVSTSSSTAGITVSGGTLAIFQGGVSTNVSNGAGLTVSGTSIVNMLNGFSGLGGITMSSTQSLSLAGGSGYDGNTVITAGTFFANDASAFGDSVGTTTVSGTGSINVSLATATDYGNEAISISGTGTINSGAIHAGGGVTQTFDGTVTLASDSLINLDASSTLVLSGSSNGTALTGNHALALAGTGALSVGGTTVNLTGINVGTAGTGLAFVAPTSGTLTVSSPISGGGGTTKTTMTFSTANAAQGSLGTILLTANNSSFGGNLSVASGNLEITAANQLGSGVGLITLNGGASPAINGTLLTNSGGTMTISNPIAISGRQGVNVNVPYIENVSGNTTFTGAVTMNSGGADYPLQSDSGTLTIQGNININSGDLITGNFLGRRGFDLQGAGNGALNGVLTDNTATQIYVTKSGAGTWTLGASSALHGNLTINDSGKLAIGAGSSVSFTDSTNTLGKLILNNPPLTAVVPGATPHINFGSTGSDTGSSLTVTSMNAPGTADTVLKLDNWTYGAGASGDHFIIANDPRSNVPQSQIQFTDFSPGYSYNTTASAARSVGEITPLIGDVNQDGHVDANDVTALLKALADIGASGTTDVNSYAHQHPSFTNSDILFALDIDGDGKDTNADIQSLINYLIIGNGGSTSPVPEPASCLLLGLSGALFLTGRYRKRFSDPRKRVFNTA